MHLALEHPAAEHPWQSATTKTGPLSMMRMNIPVQVVECTERSVVVANARSGSPALPGRPPDRPALRRVLSVRNFATVRSRRRRVRENWQLSGYRLGGGVGILTAMVVSGAFALSACGAIVERHCGPGEIVISNASGGSYCQARMPGDRTCPVEQVLERQPEKRRERCIPDRIDRNPSPSTEWLPATGA